VGSPDYWKTQRVKKVETKKTISGILSCQEAEAPNRGVIITLPDTHDIFRICHDPDRCIVTYYKISRWFLTYEEIILFMHAFCLNIPFLSESCPQQPNRWVNAEWKSLYHPLATSFQNGLGCTPLQHHTSHVLLTFSTHCQRELVCGACIGTAQVGTLLVVPLDSFFKRSSLRFIVTWS